jgi:hypothetical protein
LVTGYGGEVGVRRNPEGGTTFWFELPRVEIELRAGPRTVGAGFTPWPGRPRPGHLHIEGDRPR